MTATIAYDKSVKNLIDELSDTGHVTHRSYRKTSVTLHHNGGRLSHEGVLNVWKTRPASAHFDVDSTGSVAQYVKVNEYAWAVGNLAGNQSSISIEMANATLAPGWTVADATWKGASRLAGWLFFKVVGARPTKNNFFYHHHWSSTACAGPYMDSIYSEVLSEAQSAYDAFKGKKSPSSSPSPSTAPSTGKKSITEVARDVIAGKYGNNPERAKKLKAAGYDSASVQDEVNRLISNKTTAPSSSGTESLTKVAKDVIAGKYGNGPDRVRRLIKAHYNAAKVQAEVNRLLHTPHKSKTYKQLADEVYRGLWGNDPERSKKLKAAGYDPSSVQREVNHLVNERRR